MSGVIPKVRALMDLVVYKALFIYFLIIAQITLVNYILLNVPI